jgi:hypothetical protein
MQLTYNTNTAPSEPVVFWEVETTDTFGGQPNYSWVDRQLVCTPMDTMHYNARVIRALRRAAGLTGQRADFSDTGYYLEWRHRGACVITTARPLD